jgi:prevent-host-death family protein
MDTIGIRGLKTRASQVIRQVQERREEIEITRHGKVVTTGAGHRPNWPTAAVRVGMVDPGSDCRGNRRRVAEGILRGGSGPRGPTRSAQSSR